MFQHSRESYLFRNGRRAHGRIVVPAMASQTSTPEGLATAATVAHYEKLAASGASIVIAEYSFVHVSGRAEPHQLGLATDGHRDAVRRVAEVIRAQGAIAGMQLVHAGGKTERALTGGALMTPSGVPVPAKGRDLEAGDPMTAKDIELWKGWFTRAAMRAVEAGFELVEIHAAHGYGLSQWLSPITNLRDDLYGGSPEGRARILFEVVESVRTAIPDAILSVRMPGSDFLEGGLDSEHCIAIARGLEARGVDLVNVSSGLGGWRNPRERLEEGYLVPEAQLIQKEIRTPVIGVGGIQTRGFVDGAIAQGRFQFAAVGRAILNGQWTREH